MNLGVAVLQLSARPGDVAANLERLAETVAGLSGDIDLVVAPELFNTGYDLELLGRCGHELAEPSSGPTVAAMAQMAEGAGLTLVAGFLEIEGDGLYDSVVVVGPGEPVVYRKTHLYPPEQAVFAAGSELVVTGASGGPSLGMMICFEHAFPEVATTLALQGAEVLVIPSAVPRGYEHVLRLRTLARAQDNQVFAIGCNMADPFCGRSIVADPRGEVVAEAGTGEEVIVVTLDLEAVGTERKREPSLQLRRPELYR